MTDHPDEGALLGFSSGLISAAHRAELIAHLDACDRCRQIVAALNRRDAASEERTNTQDPLLGEMLGEYRVLEALSRGGMGVLYRGEQPVIGKPVAIKVLLPEVAEDPALVHRLLEEARAVNAIRHPNVVDIFSFGELRDGRHYIVMELLEGTSLAAMLKERQRLDVTRTLEVLAQCLSGLEAAHAAGVIHRDLKPDNIFVNPRADGWHVTLLDFGLAKRHGADRLTAPNVVMGTPGYMAPEQIRGKPATPATDIYAMGLVAWEMLAGREPFEGGSAIEVMHRHLTDPTPPLPAFVDEVAPGFQALIQKMTSKDAAARPSAGEVRQFVLRLAKVRAVAPTRLNVPPIIARELRTDPAGIPAVDDPGATVRLRPGVKRETTVPEAPALRLDLTVPVPAPTQHDLKALPHPRRWLWQGAIAGLALCGALGWWLAAPPPPPPVVVVPPTLDPLPPRPSVVPPEPVVAVEPEPVAVPKKEPVRPPPAPSGRPTRLDLEKGLGTAREQAKRLPSAATVRMVSLQLDGLQERLAAGESPAVLARELKALSRQFDLK